MRCHANATGHSLLCLLFPFLIAIAAILLAPTIAVAADGDGRDGITDGDLTGLSLEDLMSIKVTSVSRRPESMWQAASAVYVITQEDIRRSGLTSIPELLRLAPGMDVAHIDANKWAINSRGLNDRWARHLLVLIDGRTIYTPLNSGVYWDVRDTVLEDVERIEIVRGPGAAMWGANAVNGLINIITKRSEYTQGAYATALVGDEDRTIDTVRFGGGLGENGHYRAYAKYLKRGDFVLPNGDAADDEWDQRRAGFRMDWKGSATDNLSVQGDLYNGTSSETYMDPSLVPPFGEDVTRRSPVNGGHLLAHWTRSIGATGEIGLQMYYDRAERRDGTYREVENTVDLDFQHSFDRSNRQSIIYGIGCRLVDSNIRNTFRLSFDPPKVNTHIFSAFVQEVLRSKDDGFHLTLGSKFEHTSFTGFQVQPNVRAQWMMGEGRMAWASVSRAVRTPSRFERGGLLNEATFPIGGGLGGVVEVRGDPGVVAERLLAYELGYRFNPNPKVSHDVAAFYNVYDHLSVIERDATFFDPDPVPHLVVPLRFRSDMHGSTYGLEVASTIMPTHRWRLATSCSLLRISMDGPLSAETGRTEGGSPRWQFNLRSYLDLGKAWEFDTMLYWVGKLRDGDVPGYARLDLRLGRKTISGVDVSVGVRNLLDPRHAEFTTSRGDSVNEVPRSVYARVDWKF
ncbi:MAG: TonB-dependent receptor [Armatimonadota bacterium]|nr:TonB-dependent receptor [Armatimonadota bacterium]